MIAAASDYRALLTDDQLALLLSREVPPWLLLTRARADAATTGRPVEACLDDWLAIVASTPPDQPVIVMAPTIARALESRARTVGIFGGRGTGKSRQACSYVYAHCRKYAALFPGKTIRWLFVRDTYEAIRKSTLETWFTAVPRGAGTYNKNEKTYTLKLPKGQYAECLFWGLDDEKDVNKLPSLELSGAVIEEPAGGMDKDSEPSMAIDESIYWNLLPCLRQPMGLQALGRTRVILVGNPPLDTHWCHDLKMVDDPASVLFVDVPRSESPMPESYYIDLERDYTQRYGAESPFVRRYVRGEWLRGWEGQLRPEDVPTIKRADLPRFRAVGATCDPATGVGADRSVIAVVGFAEGGIAYLLDLRVSGDWGQPELEEQIFQAQEKSQRWAHGPITTFAIEAVGFQDWLEKSLTLKMPARGTRLPLMMLKRDTRVSKASRIVNALGTRIAQGRLVVVEDCAHLDQAWREMRRFNPKAKHNLDDVLDTLSDIDQIERTGVSPDSAMAWGEATAGFTRPSFWKG